MYDDESLHGSNEHNLSNDFIDGNIVDDSTHKFSDALFIGNLPKEVTNEMLREVHV